MKKILSIIVCLQVGIVFSQEEDRDEIINKANQFIAIGNDVLVEDGNFPKAEGEYRKAIAKNPINPIAKYNLANAYYNSEKYDEATLRYTEAAKVATAKEEKHKAFHNQGNTYMEQKKYKEAVESYKNALRNNPKDDKTRYNLALAKKMLEQQQQQNDQNKDDKNKDKDQNKEQNQDNKDQKEGDDKKDKKGDEGDKEKDKGEDQKDEGDKGDKEEDKKDKGDKEKNDKGEPKDDEKGNGEDQENKEGEPKDQQPQQAQGKLSPEQVKSILEAMNNQEKKVQDKINAKKTQGSKVKTDKDW